MILGNMSKFKKTIRIKIQFYHYPIILSSLNLVPIRDKLGLRPAMVTENPGRTLYAIYLWYFHRSKINYKPSRAKLHQSIRRSRPRVCRLGGVQKHRQGYPGPLPRCTRRAQGMMCRLKHSFLNKKKLIKFRCQCTLVLVQYVSTFLKKKISKKIVSGVFWVADHQ